MAAMATRHSPRITCWSVRQRPTALTLTCTSVARGGSSVIGSIDSGAPTERKTAACVIMGA
jgi:hypothetical protein